MPFSAEATPSIPLEGRSGCKGTATKRLYKSEATKKMQKKLLFLLIWRTIIALRSRLV